MNVLTFTIDFRIAVSVRIDRVSCGTVPGVFRSYLQKLLKEQKVRLTINRKGKLQSSAWCADTGGSTGHGVL